MNLTNMVFPGPKESDHQRSRGPPIRRRLTQTNTTAVFWLSRESETNRPPNQRAVEEENVMKKILMIAALVITLSNVAIGVAYACTCTDQTGGCWATGTGAECYHDAQGKCHCKDGTRPGLLEE